MIRHNDVMSCGSVYLESHLCFNIWLLVSAGR
jgi:hypothetical protein